MKGPQTNAVATPAPNASAKAPRKSVNVSIRRDVLEAARARGINLSRTLEEGLTERLRARQAEEWTKENRRSIAEYNRRVDRDGAFSEGRRRF